MIRGTFANIRLKNQLLDGVEGGFTRDFTQADGTAGVHLRREPELPGRGHAAGGLRRQGVRLGLVARLGGQGHEPPGRQGSHRRELRAHPPFEPDRHGRRAAAVPGRRELGVARARRHGDRRGHGPRGPERGHHPEDGHVVAEPSEHSPRRQAESSSTRSCASIPRAKRTTTATAASCSTCSARSSEQYTFRGDRRTRRSPRSLPGLTASQA